MSPTPPSHPPAHPAPPRHPKPLRRRGAARVIAETAPGAREDERGFIEHPDGWYWVAPDGRQQFGPFESHSLAREDRDRCSVEAADEGETLQDVERQTGLDDHIDIQTGRPVDDDTPIDSDGR
jgi:hypothetical protein